jgi:hypothetical protein
VCESANPADGLFTQIAHKLHAITAALPRPKINDRAHDLVDLQLLEALTAGIDLGDTHRGCLAVFEARAQHRWPPTVDALPTGLRYTHARWKDSTTSIWRKQPGFHEEPLDIG